MAAAGLKSDLETRLISMPVNDCCEVAQISTYSFTSLDGVKNIAFNALDFLEALPDKALARDTAKLIEVLFPKHLWAARKS